MNWGRAPTTLAIFTGHRTGPATYKRSGLRPSWASSIRARDVSNGAFELASESGAAPRLKPLSEARGMRAFVKVDVIGLGYVGVPLAAAIAATGAKVVGVDIDREKVEAINEGR